MGKCKCTGRTVLLMVVAIELCLLFCLVDQKTRFMLSRGDQSRVVGRNNVFRSFFYYSLASDGAAILAGGLIVISFSIKWFRFKKCVVVLAFSVNFIIVLPHQVSGFVLYFSTSPEGRVEVSQTRHNQFIYFIISYDNDTDLPPELVSLQEDNCCCGLRDQSDYASKRANTSILCPGKAKCPHKYDNKTETFKYPGCDYAVPAKLRLLALISTCIGSFCCLLALIITPFIYAYFEKDRREARAQFLRDWQKTIHREMEQRRLRFNEDHERADSSTSPTA